MEKKIYPRIPELSADTVRPTAPIEEIDVGHIYRLRKIEEIQKELETYIMKRKTLYKQYNRVLTGVNAADGILSTVTLASGAAGVGLLTTVVALPVVLVLEISALVTGSLSILSKFATRKLKVKADKHKQIQILAESKLNTIYDHVSKAINNNHISDEEFSMILDELEKFKRMQEEIRHKTHKEISNNEKECLIEKGRKEAEKNFRSLLEKTSKNSS